MEELIIGIDGGGTKTEAWIAPLRDASNSVVLGRGTAGSGNPRAAGFEVAQQSILAAIHAAFAAAKLQVSPVRSLWMGLAGAGRPVEQHRVQEWAAANRLAEVVHVSGDAEIILGAASADHWGIAFVCGTGSMAFGRNRGGPSLRSGGWGFLLGDEGSSFAIAQAGLRAVVCAADGRGPATALTERILAEAQVADPRDLIDWVYTQNRTPALLAQYAPLVFEAAPIDAVARAIVAQGAEDCAETIASLAHRLGIAADRFPLGLAGSAVIKQDAYRQLILDKLAARSLLPSMVLVAEPVSGAVALARAAATSPR